MIKEFFMSEEGMGVVEVVLIIVTLVAIAAIFKNQIIALVQNIWKSINSDAKDIYS